MDINSDNNEECIRNAGFGVKLSSLAFLATCSLSYFNNLGATRIFEFCILRAQEDLQVTSRNGASDM